MSRPSIVDLNALIDGQKVGRSTIVFLVVATLAMASDGFDLSAIGFVAPELVKEWHIAPAELTSVFSAGIIGLVFGAPLFGYLGDRIGRKPAIVIALGVIGGFTLATMAARSVPQFVVLRFLTGLGIGGIAPNISALAAEIAPKRLRGTFVMIVSFGVPVGLALPGFAAAWLVPAYGWPMLLFVGGILPLIAALMVLAWLTESIKYLAQRGDRDPEVRRIAAGLRPDLVFDADVHFSAPTDAGPIATGSPRGLFMDGMAWITPFIWVLLAANQMANFFTLSWLPTVLQAAGASTGQAGVNAALFSVGGMAGGLVLTFVIDRFGLLPTVVLFIVGVPLMAAIGFPDMSPAAFAAVIAGAGFCVIGNQFAINTVAAVIYQTPVRSVGIGWAQGFGRLGALAAPLIGGALLASHLPTRELLLAPAVSLLVGAAASIILAILCYRRFRGLRVDEVGKKASFRKHLEGV